MKTEDDCCVSVGAEPQRHSPESCWASNPQPSCCGATVVATEDEVQLMLKTAGISASTVSGPAARQSAFTLPNLRGNVHQEDCPPPLCPPAGFEAKSLLCKVDLFVFGALLDARSAASDVFTRMVNDQKLLPACPSQHFIVSALHYVSAACPRSDFNFCCH